ncbi:hypothetical protein AB0M95_24540 [Sphaerisporangium sp. NPDC051017]|uniref:hypothetical protein n=1 Tax=Sphaerisporangium sp. NPDC051017 TaxID=3154636 RepID=UPI00341D0A14
MLDHTGFDHTGFDRPAFDRTARRIAHRISAFGLAAALGVLTGVSPASAAPARTVTVATNVVEYTCKTDGVDEPQSVKVQVVLTMPTGAVPGRQLTIGWQGTYVGTGVKAPAGGLQIGTALYAHVGISGFDGLTSATGVGDLSPVGPGQEIPLPTSTVEVKTTASHADTGTVRPGGLNFGPAENDPTINCDVANKSALTTYTLKVGEAGGSGSPSPSPTPSATPTTTPSATPTSTPSDTPAEADDGDQAGGAGTNGKVTKTPRGGAGTGGGGDAGPDGRVFVTVGLLLILLAVAGGLARRGTGPRHHRGGSMG